MSIASIQTTVMPDIEDIDPVGPRDGECLDEIREVLERHGALHRFGITLLHQHFDLADDEVLVESIDVENRILLTRPLKREEVGPSIETSWRLDDPQAGRVCEKQCQSDRDSDGKPIHMTKHYSTS